MNSSGFSHITINISSLVKSLDFYSGILGMKITHKGNKDAYLEWGNAWVCLLERPEKEAIGNSRGVDHVAFFISSEDFDDAVAHLRSKNVKIVRGPEKRGVGSSVYFLDPDGIQLELHTSTLSERMAVWK
ncbi:VOC family protein [Peribacillus glennii]|uniref:Glutathione transferase n=1 Tax=Peribacillus glennii TaxID=2303991 RepID=A0A372L886_9BACI|nr:VOC family protein [Peribacillus glennii]RFU60543.1 glutathione transferase [Peribacillus glennii]